MADWLAGLTEAQAVGVIVGGVVAGYLGTRVVRRLLLRLLPPTLAGDGGLLVDTDPRTRHWSDYRPGGSEGGGCGGCGGD